MSTRLHIVEIVRKRALEALASVDVPDDATALEQAEGLISFALEVLSKETNREGAFQAALGIVQTYRSATLG